ncbi:ribbon-helix-helix domain-containing protein [Clostridium disporicum]|uniref:CopG-like ribbon-helix-helix domain-containing protein n=1 Tax=Clostridium disporicum TaxID=84024 RepID=A0A174AKB9_9CLOT|nr:hypothetical protein [Clostridium disporicum]CUN88100.1 Uncharacterised protein [Clostridium disporicum]SCJ28158.1 Uncharacterised protein [uncultured Clostridium sp.]DAF19026.1 MAG TPA: CopG-like protein [Caudoviricetes sp.]
MAIDKDNIRIMVTISRDENEMLKELAKKENRSVSNLVATLVKKHLKDNTNEQMELKKVMKKSLFTK